MRSSVETLKAFLSGYFSSLPKTIKDILLSKIPLIRSDQVTRFSQRYRFWAVILYTLFLTGFEDLTWFAVLVFNECFFSRSRERSWWHRCFRLCSDFPVWWGLCWGSSDPWLSHRPSIWLDCHSSYKLGRSQEHTGAFRLCKSVSYWPCCWDAKEKVKVAGNSNQEPRTLRPKVKVCAKIELKLMQRLEQR